MEKEILDILKGMQNDMKSMQNDIKSMNERLIGLETDVKDIKSDVKEFKEQFTDFESKSANNHVEVISKINNMQKDLNTVEVVTSKNWNDIAQLKAIK